MLTAGTTPGDPAPGGASAKDEREAAGVDQERACVQREQGVAGQSQLIGLGLLVSLPAIRAREASGRTPGPLL
jgi:hypothetical protein